MQVSFHELIDDIEMISPSSGSELGFLLLRKCKSKKWGSDHFKESSRFSFEQPSKVRCKDTTVVAVALVRNQGELVNQRSSRNFGCKSLFCEGEGSLSHPTEEKPHCVVETACFVRGFLSEFRQGLFCRIRTRS